MLFFAILCVLVRGVKHKKTAQTLGLRGFTIGAPSGVRTRDTLIKSQVLYQLS